MLLTANAVLWKLCDTRWLRGSNLSEYLINVVIDPWLMVGGRPAQNGS